MSITTTERRLIENEMIFRNKNESIGHKLDELKTMHAEEGNPLLINDQDLLLNFKCECSDENCEVRIPLKLSTYQQIHDDRRNFIVKIGHEVVAIEKIVLRDTDYYVVRKHNVTPEPKQGLNTTDIDNS